MSRLGKRPVSVPSGVTVQVSGRTVNVKGPKGALEWEHHPLIGVTVDGSEVKVAPNSEERLARALFGTTRQLIQNMVVGVSEGFERKLEIVGVGYNAKVQGTDLVLNIGFCHPITMPIPKGLDVTCPAPVQVVIQGTDKQLVGQFAANVRRVRPPEPYKGKGIKYSDEIIRRKQAKTFG